METANLRAARRHAERKIGFFIHLAVYTAVNGALILLNLLYVPGRPWSLAPLFGWGIGLSFHGLAVLLHKPARSWKNRMIEKELRKIEGQS